MSKYVLTNALLIDGTGAEPQQSSGLVIDGETIHSVGPIGSLPAPADAEVIDLEGKTLMPGIIDAHTHLTYHRSEYGLILQQMNESLELNTIKAVENAGMILDTGCTAIGDGACRGGTSRWPFRDGVRQGLIHGPKVVAAGPMISGSSGHCRPHRSLGLRRSRRLPRHVRQRARGSRDRSRPQADAHRRRLGQADR